MTTDRESLPWRKTMSGMPPRNQRVLAYAEGVRRHSEVRWKRQGFVFMVHWDTPTETVGPGWARRFYDDACRQLDADYLNITHWMPLEVPHE